MIPLAGVGSGTKATPGDAVRSGYIVSTSPTADGEETSIVGTKPRREFLWISQTIRPEFPKRARTGVPFQIDQAEEARRVRPQSPQGGLVSISTTALAVGAHG
jgi:hypothetical protein